MNKWIAIRYKREFTVLTVWWLVGLIVVLLFTPLVLWKQKSHKQQVESEVVSTQGVLPSVQEEAKPHLVSVFRSKKNVVEQVELEEYVRGVVAAEMPIEFELEALKAQAIASRTYMMEKLSQIDHGLSDSKAAVTDTVSDQAYVSTDEIEKKWPEDKREANWKKLNQAIQETKGKIVTYQHRPIFAAFFSTSNGYTENSEDYWNEKYPYLRSVASPWDVKLSPKYEQKVAMTPQDLTRKLGGPKVLPVSTRAIPINLIERSQGRRVKEVSIGGKMFSGREVREKLGLASSHFEWKWSGNILEITTFGYGHGVGMSQWGANGMAKQGKTAEEILHYYYTGVDIEKI